MIKNWIIRFIFKSKIRKYINSVKADEDCYAYLLDLLQEDEKRLCISKFSSELDLTHNREMQEQLKKLITRYGYNY